MKESEDLKWLGISLFCSRNNWSQLLYEGIEPFVLSLRNKRKLKQCSIEFNLFAGQNIRLSLLVFAHEAASIASKSNCFFSNYFSKKNFDIKSFNFPVEGIFMPFPVNTIRFGLYDLQYDQSRELSYKLRGELSEILLKLFRENEIDDETIISFLVYAQMTIIKTVYIQRPIDMIFLIAYFKQKLSSDELNLINQQLEEKVKENFQMIRSIGEDIFENEISTLKISWLSQWENICRQNILLDEINEKGCGLIHLVNNHLGFSVSRHIIIQNFICTWLQERIDSKKLEIFSFKE